MDLLYMFLGTVYGSLLAMGGVVIGFKMGRKTRDEGTAIIGSDMGDRGVYEEADAFSEHVNDGLEGDPNERLRTV